MSDNDMIRRGDALDAMLKGPRTVQERIDAIRAIPAVQPTASPEVQALVEAAGHARLALSGYVSQQSACDKLDAAIAAMKEGE